jgi:hypothetical protein
MIAERIAAGAFKAEPGIPLDELAAMNARLFVRRHFAHSFH